MMVLLNRLLSNQTAGAGGLQVAGCWMMGVIRSGVVHSATRTEMGSNATGGND